MNRYLLFWGKQPSVRAVAGVVTVVLMAVGTAWAGSPFGLQVGQPRIVGEGIEVAITITVPDRHVIYADTFKVSATPLKLPQAETKPDPIDPAQKVAVYSKNFESVWRVNLLDGARLHVEYQGCDDTTCFMPESHHFKFDSTSGKFLPMAEAPGSSDQGFDWSGGANITAGGGYMGVRQFLEFLDRAEGIERNQKGGGLAGFLRDPVTFFHVHGLLLTLLLVLVGGVLLNLTPCVLPMIPINLAVLGAGAGTRGRGFGLGAAYGLGIVLVYGGLGWLILRSGLFFGALQASPWFSLTVAVVFAVLALALFDLFIIDFTRFIQPGQGGGRQGAVAAFSAGALSALLAGACVAPVVLAVLLLAGTLYAGGATGAQFLPFVLGLGMALPWPLAGAGLSVLPKPGMWMVRVKQVFGVLLALLALYYFYLAAIGFMPTGESAREDSILAGDHAAWSVKVAQAKRENKPIFLDFWATWCKNCAVMERSTFEDERVKARLAGYIVVKVQAERPDQSPAREMLAAFNARGLPAFAVISTTKPRSMATDGTL